MGLLSFVKNAGAKLFGIGDTNEEKAAKIKAQLDKFSLDTSALSIRVEDETVFLKGRVKTIFDKIRLVATAGNIDGISAVNDDGLSVGEAVDVDTEVPEPEPEKTYYTVVKGDSLSKIAKQFYNDYMKYPIIFEANRPMLSDPDLIYPGQMLVIPALEA